MMFEIKTRDVEFGIERPVRPGKKKITFNKIKFASKNVDSKKPQYIKKKESNFTGLGKSGYGKILTRNKGESLESLAKRQSEEFSR